MPSFVTNKVISMEQLHYGEPSDSSKRQERPRATADSILDADRALANA